MTPFRYFQTKDGLPDSKGFLLSEKPSQGITQVDQKFATLENLNALQCNGACQNRQIKRQALM